MSDPSSRPADGGSGDTPVFRSPALIIAALVLAESVSAFESGMIFIALPRLGEYFGAPASTTGWSVTAYMLVAATAALVGGRLGDIYGRKKILVIAMLVSVLGSVISVFGDSMAAIILGRGVQGAAGAILPLCYGLAREVLPAQIDGVSCRVSLSDRPRSPWACGTLRRPPPCQKREIYSETSVGQFVPPSPRRSVTRGRLHPPCY